jgi:hypothetical protein
MRTKLSTPSHVPLAPLTYLLRLARCWMPAAFFFQSGMRSAGQSSPTLQRVEADALVIRAVFDDLHRHLGEPATQHLHLRLVREPTDKKRCPQRWRRRACSTAKAPVSMFH